MSAGCRLRSGVLTWVLNLGLALALTGCANLPESASLAQVKLPTVEDLPKFSELPVVGKLPDAVRKALRPSPESVPPPRLDIEAPSELKALLTQYLDLTRALALPDANNLDEAEWARLLAAAPSQTQELARTLGYFHAKAQIQALGAATGAAPAESQDARLAQQASQQQASTHLLTVSAGPRARVARLEFQVEGELQAFAARGDPDALALKQHLLQAWAQPVGERFSNAEWASAKNTVIGRLRAEGYASARWLKTQADVDAVRNSVDMEVVVDSGPLYRAGPIRVEGAAAHPPAEVRGLSGLKPGVALTEARLGDYQDQLLKTGLYDQVSVSMNPDPSQAQQAEVLVKVKESPLHTANFSIGDSISSGPRATVEHIYRRLFGWPATVRNKLVYGKQEQVWTGEISTHTDEKFNRNFGNVTLDHIETSDQIVVSKRLRLGRAKSALVNEHLNFIEVEDSREALLPVVSADSKWVTLSAVSLNQQMIWRTLDSPVLPTDGYILQWQHSAGLSNGTYNRPGAFGRVYGRAIGYWPLGSSWFAQGRLEGGRVFLPHEVGVPDSQLFRAGGDESVRGYTWRSLGPLDSSGSVTSGQMLLTSSVEIAHPFSSNYPSFWWAAFLDAGRAADQPKDLKPALGYGLGFRWRSPVGPLRLDWAWGQEVRHARLYLSVGIGI